MGLKIAIFDKGSKAALEEVAKEQGGAVKKNRRSTKKHEGTQKSSGKAEARN